MKRPSWETSVNDNNYTFKKPSWETPEASTFNAPQDLTANTQDIKTPATKTPLDQRINVFGVPDDSRSYIGMNIIPAYKEDSNLAKVGKGIVNYGIGGALSLVGNIFGAPQQAMMQTTRATANAVTGKPQDFSEMTFGKDILGAKEDNLLTTAVGAALDPATYLGGGIADDLSRAGQFGKGATLGTAENLTANAARGQRAAKGMVPSAQQATREYLNAERNAARDVQRPDAVYGQSTGVPQQLALPAPVREEPFTQVKYSTMRTPKPDIQPSVDNSLLDSVRRNLDLPPTPGEISRKTGADAINLIRKTLDMDGSRQVGDGVSSARTSALPRKPQQTLFSENLIDRPFVANKSEIPAMAARKETEQPRFTAYTNTGPKSADTRTFTDNQGKTIAQALQGDEVYDDIVKNLEGINHVSDDTVKEIAQGIKDKSGLTLNLKDVYRNFRDAFGRAYPLVKERYLDPFDASKKSYVDTLKTYTDGIYEKVVKGLGIKKSSKESAAVQWYGEGQRMAGMKDEIDPQTGKKITIPNMVPYTLQDLQIEFPTTWQNITQADTIFRSAYNNLIDDINQTRRQIYPTNPEKLVPKRADYYRHFREMQDSFEGFKNMFETPSQIDPKLAGISEFTKPKSRWASFMQKRGMGSFKADAVGGFLDYIQPAAYAIHIDPQVAKFRGLAKDIAEGTANTKNANNFIKYLNDFSNYLAGKTSKYDRLIQEDIPGGRTAMRVLTWLNNRVKANQVLLNARSAVSQLANVPAGIARIKDPVAIGKGIGDTLAGIIGKGENAKLYSKSQFISERYSNRLISRFDQGILDQPKRFAAWLLGAFDELGTKFIWNSAYNKALSAGIKEPIKQADDLTRSIVAGRGKGEVPLMQQSQLFQLFAPFQLEVANLWHVMGDMVKEKDFAGIITLFVGNYLFNNAAEELSGNRVTFDPIDAIVDALSEDDMNAWKMAGRLGGEALSNIPLGQTIATLFPENETMIPTPAGEYTIPSREELFGENDPTRFGSGLLVAKGLQDPLTKLIPPFGGAQVKKTAEAINALNKGGEFNGDKLRYLVEATPENAIKGALFGKNAFDEAKDYYNKDRRELSENQTMQVMNSSDQEASYEALMHKRKIDTLRSKIKAIQNGKMSGEEKVRQIEALQKQLEKAVK
jgi:hypothetical protein